MARAPCAGAHLMLPGPPPPVPVAPIIAHSNFSRTAHNTPGANNTILSDQMLR